MSSSATTVTSPSSRLDLSRWSKAPLVLIVLGGLVALVAAVRDPATFGVSYLFGYMFLLSICLGCLFLVLVHHLFDASWTVPIRRVAEHIAFLLPIMAVLFLPIALLAPKIYPWMNLDPHSDHALHAKQALLNKTSWYTCALVIFALWTLLTYKLRYWSIKQDETGSAECTYKLRFHSYWGIFAFAFTLSLAVILWVKSIEHQWFSTMYGVYYFAESVWTTLATLYIITLVLKRNGPLSQVANVRQFHDLGVLWFAFTVFYAYIHFSQYFIIWNANMPEETSWYVEREKGSWWDIGLLIIFGHFFLPFLALLRIDAKLTLPVVVPLAVWAWLMHYCDVAFNVMPRSRPNGFTVSLGDLACLAFIGGVLASVFLKYFRRHPPFPQKDPRMIEALGLHHPQVSSVAVAKYEGLP